MSQSRQSVRLFLQSSELGPPTPLPVGECVPPLVQGRRHGEGGSQFRRGDSHCGTLGIFDFVGCVMPCKNTPLLAGWT